METSCAWSLPFIKTINFSGTFHRWTLLKWDFNLTLVWWESLHNSPIKSISDSHQLKALVKRNASHRKSTQVLLLALTCIPFGHSLAFTCEDLRRLAFDLNMYKFWTQVRPTCVSPLATQRKWIQVFASHSNFVGNLLANLMPLFEQESQTISRLSRFPFWQDGFCHGAKFGKL